MGRKSGHRFSLHDEFLLSCFPQDAGRGKPTAVPSPYPVDPETLATEPDGSVICLAEITAGEAQVMYGIQDVRLSPSVRSADGHDGFVEDQGRSRAVAELECAYFL